MQYPRLESQTRADMWTINTLATIVGALFSDWEYTWLLPEFEESITLELDFLQEATNAERIANLFGRTDCIHIPKIRWDLSSHRVLTMEVGACVFCSKRDKGFVIWTSVDLI